MKLRFVKNLYWYDGPLANLYLDEDKLELWIGVAHVEPQKKEEIDNCVWIARKMDETVEVGVDIIWPEGFFDLDKHDNFYKFNPYKSTTNKEWGYTLEFMFDEATLISEVERQAMIEAG